MLTKPEHIALAHLGHPSVRYIWNQWNTHQVYRPANPELWARLQGLSHRGIVGLTIATGEWVAYRFESMTDRLEPLQLLEAGWAANVHRAYSYPFHTDGVEWRGPVLGPLNLMMAIVVDSLYGRNPRTNPAESPCWMARLAEHVLPNVTAFRAWQDVCIGRLNAFCRAEDNAQSGLFEDDALDGELVPRELFDPTFEYNPELSLRLIGQFLLPLENDEDNPFLATPEEMLEDGFVGTPYRLHLLSDPAASFGSN